MPRPVAFIDITDGGVTNVTASHNMDVVIIDRTNIDPSDSGYREEVFGAPGQIATFDVEADPDVMEQFTKLMSSDPNCGEEDGSSCEED